MLNTAKRAYNMDMKRSFFFTGDFEEFDDEQLSELIDWFEHIDERANMPQVHLQAPIREPIKRPINHDDILYLMKYYRMSVQDIQDVFLFSKNQ
jgi:hypothetical protein